MSTKDLNITKITIQNMQSGILSKLLGVVVAMITLPIIISGLGTENYGLWVLISQVFIMFGTLDFGITNSIGRVVAHYKGQDDAINQSAYSAFLMILVFSSILVLCIYILTENIELLLSIEENQKENAIYLFWILGLGLVLDFFLRIGKGIITGFHRFDLVYSSQIAGNIIKLILIYLTFKIYDFGGLIYLGIISVITMIIPSIIVIIYVFREVFPMINFRTTNYSTSIMKKLFSLGSSNIISNIVISISKSLSFVIISNIISIHSVSVYSIPLSFLVYPSMLINTFLLSFTTLSAELMSKNDLAKIRKITLLGIKYSFALNIGLLFSVILVGKQFLTIWLGDSFSDNDFNNMHYIFIILTLSYTLTQITDPISKVLKGINQHWVVTKINFVNNLCGLSFGFFLLSYTSYGILGMAYGWFLSSVISSLIIYPIAAKKIKLVDIRSIVKSILPAITYIGIPLTLVMNFPTKLQIDSWIGLLVSSIILLFFVLLVLYKFIFDANHKKMVREKLFR